MTETLQRELTELISLLKPFANKENLEIKRIVLRLQITCPVQKTKEETVSGLEKLANGNVLINGWNLADEEKRIVRKALLKYLELYF